MLKIVAQQIELSATIAIPFDKQSHMQHGEAGGEWNPHSLVFCLFKNTAKTFLLLQNYNNAIAIVPNEKLKIKN